MSLLVVRKRLSLTSLQPYSDSNTMSSSQPSSSENPGGRRRRQLRDSNTTPSSQPSSSGNPGGRRQRQLPDTITRMRSPPPMNLKSVSSARSSSTVKAEIDEQSSSQAPTQLLPSSSSGKVAIDEQSFSQAPTQLLSSSLSDSGGGSIDEGQLISLSSSDSSGELIDVGQEGPPSPLLLSAGPERPRFRSRRSSRPYPRRPKRRSTPSGLPSSDMLSESISGRHRLVCDRLMELEEILMQGRIPEEQKKYHRWLYQRVIHQEASLRAEARALATSPGQLVEQVQRILDTVYGTDTFQK
ncbi:hypothetical protein BC939DRAFT_445157 [Gamsiella multidivaricata]|uniref:uncharacterized protein n=1 Tax=Gamsiella multidivaricata TaxID=101098 RepID=UPI00221FC78A|nr:uncharacterized protein BC939DRAFT_445157 [Gamsiella multidivaricata]KAI7827419.1 hypothetical protein BC939DRAFT_445157 [Gamsiella multidivaricata]